MPDTAWITHVVIQWISNSGNVLVPEVQTWLNYLAIIALVYWGLRWALQTASGAGGDGFMGFVGFVASFLLVKFVLSNYSTPIWGGVSLHSLIPETGRRLAQILNETSLGAAVKTLDNTLAAINPPDLPWHPIEVLSYGLVVLLTWLLEGILFLLTVVGFVALGIGIVLGPIPW